MRYGGGAHPEGSDQPTGEQGDQRVDPVTGVPVADHAQAKANVGALTAMMLEEDVAPETPGAVAEQAGAPVA